MFVHCETAHRQGRACGYSTQAVQLDFKSIAYPKLCEATGLHQVGLLDTEGGVEGLDNGFLS